MYIFLFTKKPKNLTGSSDGDRFRFLATCPKIQRPSPKPDTHTYTKNNIYNMQELYCRSIPPTRGKYYSTHFFFYTLFFLHEKNVFFYTNFFLHQKNCLFLHYFFST